MAAWHEKNIRGLQYFYIFCQAHVESFTFCNMVVNEELRLYSNKYMYIEKTSSIIRCLLKSYTVESNFHMLNTLNNAVECTKF